jgi:F-type H+-transporting ATPase subunit gamma
MVMQVGRAIPTFADAAGIADLIVKSGEQWDVLTIIYNKCVHIDLLACIR